MLEFAESFPEVSNYLPEERDIDKLPKAWIANVIYTIVGIPFRDWVKERVR